MIVNTRDRRFADLQHRLQREQSISVVDRYRRSHVTSKTAGSVVASGTTASRAVTRGRQIRLSLRHLDRR